MTEAEIALALAEAIKPMLAGHDPRVQGAALAELLATWLAGHQADTPRETERMRDLLLRGHIDAVRQLVPLAHLTTHGGDGQP